ncbi:hypothetical protein [Streptomyces sp. NPDC046870]
MSEDSRKALIERSTPFLSEVRNRTAGKDLESWLNTTYGLSGSVPRAPLR